VLLGSAILAARAAEHFPSVVATMAAMSKVASVLEPSSGSRAFHEAKHRVFLRMHDDQLAYRSLMTDV
jgi:ribulose kinase